VPAHDEGIVRLTQKGLISLRKIIATLAVIGGMVIGMPLVVASPASAVTTTSIRLTNAPSNLGWVDVMDNHNVSGNAVWTYDSTGNGVSWVATARGVVTANSPFTNSDLDSDLIGKKIYTFGDAQNSSLCLGQASGNVQLRSCSVNGSLWVLRGSWSNGTFSGWLVNVERSNALDDEYVLAAPGYGNQELLHVDYAGAAGDWRTWSFD
jgi:hypothetical protein